MNTAMPTKYPMPSQLIFILNHLINPFLKVYGFMDLVEGLQALLWQTCLDQPAP